jgi:hypothetical protein
VPNFSKDYLFGVIHITGSLTFTQDFLPVLYILLYFSEDNCNMLNWWSLLVVINSFIVRCLYDAATL